MRRISKLVFLLVLALSVGAFGLTDADARQKKSKAELDKAKKAGDQSQAAADAAREDFGREADEANIEATERVLKKKASGTSTYGVAGFDYLTGVGKVASSPKKMGAKYGDGKLTSNINTPLAKLMEKRFKKNQWTGQLGETESGWGEKTGITEVWMRGAQSGALGGNYNQWVNTWNDITRPDTKGQTLVAGADPDTGAHWFSFYCVHCHGWGAKGDGPTAAPLDPRPRNLTNGKYANYISNLELFAIIKGGGAARNLSEAMPPWGNIMQDQDIWNVVAFIRSLPAKEAYVPDASDVTAANAGKNEEFKDLNEELELMQAGRGGKMVGGYDSIGGGRLASKKVGLNGVKTSGHGGGSFADGDWSMDTK